MARSEQVEELAHTLTRQVAWNLTPLMDNPDDNHQKIIDSLNQMTHESRILDASLYDSSGSLVAHSGENINVRDRLALDGQRAGSFFNHQIVQQLATQEGPRGFLRVTMDTHVLVTEAKQVDNTTNILRLMMLLALAIGIILSRTLLRSRRTRWQQSPFLLTANNPVKEDDEEDEEKSLHAVPVTDAAKKTD